MAVRREFDEELWGEDRVNGLRGSYVAAELIAEASIFPRLKLIVFIFNTIHDLNNN